LLRGSNGYLVVSLWFPYRSLGFPDIHLGIAKETVEENVKGSVEGFGRSGSKAFRPL